MQQLWKRWKDVAAGIGLPGHRFIEYTLMAAYSGVAILAVISGLTAKTGGLLSRTVEQGSYAAKPEFRAIFKQLLMATADFSAGASLLVIAALVLYWGRRNKGAGEEALEPPLPSGPPFYL